MNKTIIAALVIIILILAGGLGYFIFQNQTLLSQKTASPTPSSTIYYEPPREIPSPIPSNDATPKITLKQLQENIQASVNSKNYQALATYMKQPKVNFSLMSTECCEPQTPDKAAGQMSYIESGIPLDFNQEADLIKTLKSKNPQLTQTFIGISKSGEQLAAFTINSDNKITAIQLSVCYNLYSL